MRYDSWCGYAALKTVAHVNILKTLIRLIIASYDRFIGLSYYRLAFCTLHMNIGLSDMRQFKSLTRLLIFYAFSLLIMLVLYYIMIFSMLKNASQHHSQIIFDALHYEVTQHKTITDSEIVDLLKQPLFQEVSYQIILMLPSGQSYVHRYTGPQEKRFTTVVFPSLSTSDVNNNYQLTNDTLTGVIKLLGGHQLYVVLRHKPLDIQWLSYQYWLPLLIAIALFSTVVLYMLKRRSNWLQLLGYIEDMPTTAKEAHTLFPFIKQASTPEFIRLGHALARVSYQLHSNYRRIKTLSHRLERLVDQAPLPMLMIMRQGQISFFNQRFEQVFATIFQPDNHYSLTDFVQSNDEATQQLLQQLSMQRLTRTLLVYGVNNRLAYHLHITPWFDEQQQIQGFTAILSPVSAFIKQADEMRLQNQQLQLQLKEFAQLRSIVGHELRIPLRSIINTLKRVTFSTMSTEQQQVLATLKQSSQSMLAMLNDMLKVTKVEAGKVQIVNEPTDIFRLGLHVSKSIADHARQKNIELLYLFMPECPRFISTDVERLQQILLNFMQNAIELTQSGYVALVIEPVFGRQSMNTNNTLLNSHFNEYEFSFVDQSFTSATSKKLEPINNYFNKNKTTGDLTAETITTHHWIRFSIKDTGNSMTEPEQQRLFSYFDQDTIKLSPKPDDRQLGLTISNSFAQLLGGFIQLDNANLENIFSLYLPCLAPIYQPVYDFQPTQTPIYLIALVKHDICLNYLQRLCQHLSISASIYILSAAPSSAQLATYIAHKKANFAPVLLLDSEDYGNQRNYKSDTDTDTDTDTKRYDAQDGDNPYYDIHPLLALPLPKILLSMRPERGILLEYLQQFDGFLNKPLDVTLLLSELLRLTQPKLLTQPAYLSNSMTDNRRGNFNEKNALSTSTPLAANNTDTINSDKLTAPLILVVEDNMVNQKVACKLLERLGYRTIVAADGQQALEQLAAARAQISLILMDCRMPVMDGLEATQAIRAQGDSIPIVALTANTSEEDREACYASGMDDFLAKPVNKEQLDKVLKRLIVV